MGLQDKYATLIDTAKSNDVIDLQVREQNNVLYIDGKTSSAELKDKLWDMYNQIDPDYRASDLILNIDASAAAGTEATVTTQSSNLNVRKGPGTDQEIVGKVAHGASVKVLSRANNLWSLIRTNEGQEGYVYSQYLTQN